MLLAEYTQQHEVVTLTSHIHKIQLNITLKFSLTHNTQAVFALNLKPIQRIAHTFTSFTPVHNTNTNS